MRTESSGSFFSVIQESPGALTALAWYCWSLLLAAIAAKLFLLLSGHVQWTLESIRLRASSEFFHFPPALLLWAIVFLGLALVPVATGYFWRTGVLFPLSVLLITLLYAEQMTRSQELWNLQVWGHFVLIAVLSCFFFRFLLFQGRYRSGVRVALKSVMICCTILPLAAFSYLCFVCAAGTGEIASSPESVEKDLARLYSKGRFDLVRTLALKALRAESGGEETHATAVFHRYAGQSCSQLYRYQEGLDHFRKAVAILSSGGERMLLAQTLSEMGITLALSGQEGKGVESVEKALHLVEDPQQRIPFKLQLATVNLLAGNDSAGKQAMRGAVFDIQRFRDEKAYAPLMIQMAGVLQSVGSCTDAIPLVKGVLDKMKPAAFEMARGYQILGGCSYMDDNIDQAEKELQKSRKLFTSAGDPFNESSVLLDLAEVALGADKYADALEDATQSLRMTEADSARDDGWVIRALTYQGAAYVMLDRGAEAMAPLQRASGIAKKSKRDSLSLEVSTMLGYALLNQGKLKEAEDTLISMQSTYELMRGKIGTVMGRTAFASLHSDPYQLLAALYVSRKEYERALETIERGRAAAFSDLLATRELSGRLQDAHEVFELSSALEALKEESDESGTNELMTKRAEMLERIQEKDPELGSLLVAAPPRLRDIQNSLDADSVILEYYHTGRVKIGTTEMNKLCIFVITGSSLEVVEVPQKADQMLKEVEDLFDSMKNSLVDPQTFKTRAGVLYDLLIGPVRPYISNRDPVIVPWNYLFYVPYAALYDSETQRYFSAEKGYTIVPSSSAYRFVRPRRKSNRIKLFAVGNPTTPFGSLPYAGDEINRIGTFFPHYDLLSGSRGTETAIKEIITQPDILHLATHSNFNPNMPMFSAVALAPDKDNDGLLEVHEIMQLHLDQVSLVTLSSCSSGQARMGAGEDVMGFFAAFLFSGTPSVLASLWPVDDKTTEALMIAFYRHYVKDQESKASALRHAQQEMDQLGVPPPLWSAFTMFGDSY